MKAIHLFLIGLLMLAVAAESNAHNAIPCKNGYRYYGGRCHPILRQPNVDLSPTKGTDELPS